MLVACIMPYVASFICQYMPSPKQDRGCDLGFSVTTISSRGRSHGWKSEAKVSLFVVIYTLFIYTRYAR